MLRILFVLGALVAAPAALAASETATLYKTPGCTCCEAYAEYLRDNGFRVEVVPTHDLVSIKSEHGVPASLSGCHTTLIGDYAFEGHIPVDSVRRVLDEQPGVAGISVPGMPQGSPGMTGALREPMRVWTIPAQPGARPQPFDTWESAAGWR